MHFIHRLPTKRILLLFVSAAMVFATALPAAAAPPEKFKEPIILLFPDIVNERSVFVNITARDFCDWAATDFDGPPPVQKLLDAQAKENDDGAVVASYKARNVYIELWEFDEGVDPGDPSTLIGPCEDIQNQLDDPGAQPWASGFLATLSGRDNDLFQTGSRGNAFGDQASGVVRDGDGARYTYAWKFRISLNPDGELLYLRDISRLRVLQ